MASTVFENTIYGHNDMLLAHLPLWVYIINYYMAIFVYHV